MKRYAFSRRTRFRFVEQDGSDAGDFEIERRTPGGLLMATSLEHGAERTFTLLDLRQAIAEDRLHFHLEGRHALPATDGKASISPREPDFSALPARDRGLARHRYEAIRPLIGKAERTSADVLQRAEAVAQADPNKRRKNAGSSVSERTVWTWLRWYEEAGDIRGLLPHTGDRRRGRPPKSDELHQVIADRLEARWLQRPPWPLTDVALEVVAEVERRNRDRPAGEHILLRQTAAGQVRLHTLERMVQRQAQRIDDGERIAAQRGRAASRAHWDPNVGVLRVDRLLDRVDYDAVRLPILVVDEEHRLVIGRPWFPPHVRVVPEIVAALDLAESVTLALAELGHMHLREVGDGLEPSWDRRPQRRRSVRSIVPSSARVPRPHPRLQHSSVADAVWDDRAEQDARGLVALLFVAGGMRRTELSEALRLSAGRLDRACAFLNVSPPHGLALLESGDRIELVSAPDCSPLIERFLNKPVPEPLSQAAMEVLSIVAYEQPITRAEISHIRATDSSGVIETLLARKLIEDDPRFGSRGRPSFLATTADFLRSLGLGSLAELPPRPVLPAVV